MSEPELIFVTDITDYIRGEKNCHVEKFQLSILNLNNLWSFIEVKAIFFKVWMDIFQVNAHLIVSETVQLRW